MTISSSGENNDKILCYNIRQPEIGDLVGDLSDHMNQADYIVVEGFNGFKNGKGINSYASAYNGILGQSYTSTDGPALLNNERFFEYDRVVNVDPATTTHWAEPGSFCGYRGFHTFVSGSSLTIYSNDIRSRGDTSLGATQLTARTSFSFIVIHDQNLDRDYLYNMTDATTGGWYRVPLSPFATGSVEVLADPPWGTGILNKMIYYPKTNSIFVGVLNTTTWSQYHITENSWSQMAPMPVANGALTSKANQDMISVVDGRMGNWVTSTSSPTDVIFACLNTSTRVLYRYDIASDEWRTSGITLPYSLSVTTTACGFAIHDNWIFQPETPLKLSRYNLLSGSSGSWKSSNNVVAVDNSYGSQVSITSLKVYPAKLRVPPGQTINYWISADKDAVRVVTQQTVSGRSHWYWMSFGAFDSLVSQDQTIVTADIVSGNVKTIPLADAAVITKGQPLIAQAKTGEVVGINVGNVSGSSMTTVQVPNTIPKDSFIGLDPTPSCLIGTDCVAATNHGPGGYKADKLSTWYNLSPIYQGYEGVTVQPEYFASGSNSRKIIQPQRMIMNNTWDGLNMSELRGSPRGVMIILKELPLKLESPKAGDVVTFGKKRYLVVDPYENFHLEGMYSNDSMGKLQIWLYLIELENVVS